MPLKFSEKNLTDNFGLSSWMYVVGARINKKYKTHINTMPVP
jgi:hypothetical protein